MPAEASYFCHYKAVLCHLICNQKKSFLLRVMFSYSDHNHLSIWQIISSAFNFRDRMLREAPEGSITFLCKPISETVAKLADKPINNNNKHRLCSRLSSQRRKRTIKNHLYICCDSLCCALHKGCTLLYFSHKGKIQTCEPWLGRSTTTTI